MIRWASWGQGLGQYALAALLTLVLVAKLQFLQRITPDVPLGYSGDSILFETWCKTLVEQGWPLHNPALGAPHGQSLHDFPMSDALNFLFFKSFTLFTRNAQVALNLFTAATYVATTLTALCVLRMLGIMYAPALAAALMYSLLPYHFARLDGGHHLLACYYVVPFSILLALWLYLGRLGTNTECPAPSGGRDAEVTPAGRWCAALLIAVAQGAAGVYYAFFAMYFVAVGGLASALQRRSWRPAVASGLLILVTGSTVAANLAPSLLYWKEHGMNPAVAARPLCDSELYAFKLCAMLYPMPGHRIGLFNALRDYYDRETFARTENSWSAQGIVANVGFLALLGILIYRRPVARVLEGLSILNVFGILLGTVGGLGVLFSVLVMPQLRGQNRISVFLSFCSLACVAVLLEAAWRRLSTTRLRQYLASGLLILLVGFAMWEQHPYQCRPDYLGVKTQWDEDAAFVSAVESSLPEGAMIYQVPYVSYPESPPVGLLEPYTNLRYYLHSSKLRWSGGAMRGREADQWQKQIAAWPLGEQLQAIAAAGFAGIQVNRAGYDDFGESIEQQLREQLGVEPIVGPGENESFFPLPAAGQAVAQCPEPGAAVSAAR